MLRPVSVDDTESGRYDLVIRATDQGQSNLCEKGLMCFFLQGTQSHIFYVKINVLAVVENQMANFKCNTFKFSYRL